MYVCMCVCVCVCVCMYDRNIREIMDPTIFVQSTCIIYIKCCNFHVF